MDICVKPYATRQCSGKPMHLTRIYLTGMYPKWRVYLISFTVSMDLFIISFAHHNMYQNYEYSSLAAKSFNQDISNWNLASSTQAVEMFKGATSFNQNLCSWSDKFPYGNADGIFQDSGCTIKDDPSQNQQGPFCASDCNGNGGTGEETDDVVATKDEPVDEVVDTVTTATEPAVLITPESVSATEPAIVTTPESVDATEPAIVTTPAVDTEPSDKTNFPPPPAPGATAPSSASLHSNGGLIVVSMAIGLVLSFFV